MTITLIEYRLQQYSILSKQDELNAIKEIVQEIILAGLSRSDFFKQAAFQGGTCLRIVYGLPRFSEDLDFILIQPDKNFIWQPYLTLILTELKAYGFQVEGQDRSKADTNIKKAFIKDDSFGQILKMNYKRNASDAQKIQIKLEIDIHPPLGSHFDVKFLDFPFPFSLTLQDFPSLFAGKCHALLCRDYIKGRDWYDFTWYVSQKIDINYPLLQNALHQSGPWKDKDVSVTKSSVIEALYQKVNKIDWESAKKDVIQFLKPKEAETLNVWGTKFFNHLIKKLDSYSSF